MTKESFFLLFISIGVFPAALGYGLNPKELLPVLYGIDVSDNNLSNIFRAVMGLYIGCEHNISYHFKNNSELLQRFK